MKTNTETMALSTRRMLLFLVFSLAITGLGQSAAQAVPFVHGVRTLVNGTCMFAYSPHIKLLAIGLLSRTPGELLLCSIDDHGVNQTLWKGRALKDFVTELAFNSEGTLLVVASGREDMRLQVWNVSDPRQPRHFEVFRGHRDAIVAMGFAPNGSMLATASGDGSIRLWQTSLHSAPTLITALKGNGGVANTVSFSPDGSLLMFGTNTGAIGVWNVSSPTHAVLLALKLNADESPIFSVAWSPDGRQAATGDRAGIIKLWSFKDAQWQPIFSQKIHTQAIGTILFSTHTRTVLTTGFDGLIAWWTITRGATGVKLLHSSTSGVPMIKSAWSADEKSVLVGSMLLSKKIAMVQEWRKDDY